MLLAAVAAPVRTASARAGDRIIHRILFGKVADTDKTVLSDDVTREHRVVFLKTPGHDADQLLHILLKIRMQVGDHAADHVIVHRHARATSLLENIEHHLALTEAIEEGSRGTEVHGCTSEREQMRRDAHQLIHHSADDLRAARHLKTESLLDAHT